MRAPEPKRPAENARGERMRVYVAIAGAMLVAGLATFAWHRLESKAPAVPIDSNSLVTVSIDAMPVSIHPVVGNGGAGLTLGELAPKLADHDAGAHPHPHGSRICGSGCVASNHPTPILTRVHFENLMKRFATEPVSEESKAFETLLYFGRQSRKMLDDEQLPVPELSDDRSRRLAHELDRTHVVVELRLVDEQDVVRARLAPTRVPLDVRHAFEVGVEGIQPVVANGTVKRVGLHHLWTRL